MLGGVSRSDEESVGVSVPGYRRYPGTAAAWAGSSLPDGASLG